MRRLVFCFALLLALAGLGQQGAAQSTAPLRALPGDDSRGLTAVGRINMADGSFCTGALIGPSLVLTAAHCMFDLETGARIPDRDVEFVADWRAGRGLATRRVARSLVHPDFVLEEATFVERVAFDVALLELDAPISRDAVAPLEVNNGAMRGDQVGVVSYAHNRADTPSLQEACRILSEQNGSYILSCVVDFGSSGAPIFVFESGRPKIVSVVSAKAKVREKPVALGAALAGPLAELMAMREMPAVSASRLRPSVLDTPRAGGDARFLRP